MSEKVKKWVSKWWDTRGVIELEGTMGEETLGYSRPIPDLFSTELGVVFPNHYHDTRDEAVEKAERLRRDEIDATNRRAATRIRELEAMRF